MRRAIPVLAAVLVLAGCGGGKSGTTTQSSAASDRAAITSLWLSFFNGKQTSGRAAMLEDGGKFGKELAAIQQNPLAAGLSAKVGKVVLQGADKATVTYTLYLNKNAVLKNATGTAVRVGGHWLVGVGSFCQLLALEGAKPAACSGTGG